MLTKGLFPALLLSFNLLLTMNASAELVVIVHPSLELSELDQKTLKKVFLKKRVSLPGNVFLNPIDYDEASTTLRDEFYNKTLLASLDYISSYWTRQAFEGKTLPPEYLSSPSEVLRRVSSDPSSIGYIDSSLLSDTVKVLTITP